MVVCSTVSEAGSESDLTCEDGTAVRKEASYEVLGKDKFLFSSYSTNVQYLHLYTARLLQLRPRVKRAMQ